MHFIIVDAQQACHIANIYDDTTKEVLEQQLHDSILLDQ